MYAAPGETVIGFGLAQTYGLGVGDSVTVQLRLNERRTEEIQLTVVGVYVAGHNLGRVLMYGADTLHDLGIIDDSADPIGYVALKLGRGVDASVCIVSTFGTAEGEMRSDS
jgi:hypothetical protein